MRPERRLARLLHPRTDDYDTVFLDAAPSISLASEHIFAPSDAAPVPTMVTALPVRTLARLGRHLEREGPPGIQVLPFSCMTDRRKALHRQEPRCGGWAPLPFPGRRDPVRQAGRAHGRRACAAPCIRPPRAAANTYRALWREVRQHVDRGPDSAAGVGSGDDPEEVTP